MLFNELIPQHIDYEKAREFSLNWRPFQECVLRYLDLSLSQVTSRGNCREVSRVSTSKQEKLKFQGSMILNKNLVLLSCNNTKHLVENKHVLFLRKPIGFYPRVEDSCSVQCLQKPLLKSMSLFRFLFSFLMNQCQIISQLYFAGNL